MAKVKFMVVQRGKTAPERNTQPRSYWRELFGGMKRGDFFILPKQKHGSVSQAACTYARGRFTIFKIEEGYCCQIIK